MNNINYQKELEKIIQDNVKNNITPTLFLHSCCAPCSSYVLSYLAKYFDITVFYYNPNISIESEYLKRVAELKRLLDVMPLENTVKFVEGRYEPEKFFEIAKGLEDAAEGGERCFKCYEMRLLESAILASEQHFDYFTTTLSISPHKNAQKLNEIGQQLGREYNIKYLPSDFKKKNGYKISIDLSEKYDLYRQNYCGCIFSKR